MERIQIKTIRGELPGLAMIAPGDGYGAGYGDGDGYGSGYGSGSGAGYGAGYGDGSGYGAGDGSGYGSGYDAGYGAGYGYGDGSGSGAGDGSGYGSGYDAGYGAGEYWRAIAITASQKWSLSQQARFSEVFIQADALAFWKSDANGLPSNGGLSKEAAYPGLVQEISGPLQICTKDALHATLAPGKWKGERLWVVALFGEVQWQDDKCAALKREIIGEIL